MTISSSITKFEIEVFTDILKKNKVTGAEKNKHLIMFGEAKANGEAECYPDFEFDKFVTAYCKYWGLKE